MTGTPPTPEPRGAETPVDASIAHAGEAGILARILPGLPSSAAVEVGPGDDAAVVRLASRRLVVTTDTLMEGSDFLMHATRPAWIGAKAAVQNLADVAAMGARPEALVVAVSAPASTRTEVLEEISAALAARAARDGAVVVGGDLGTGPVLSVTVTALGSLPDGTVPIERSGARPDDVLAIGAPVLGRSGAGLAWILTGRADDPVAADAVAWHDAPDPDLALGWTAARRPDGTPVATAMLDVSDGLVRDGGRLARASGVVLDLDAGSLTRDAEALEPLAEPLGADPWAWVLHGGEEHAMLATFPSGTVPDGFRRIGTVREAAGHKAPGLVLLDGAPVRGEGFDHFA